MTKDSCKRRAMLSAVSDGPREGVRKCTAEITAPTNGFSKLAVPVAVLRVSIINKIYLGLFMLSPLTCSRETFKPLENSEHRKENLRRIPSRVGRCYLLAYGILNPLHCVAICISTPSTHIKLPNNDAQKFRSALSYPATCP
jgi:hypothetical protein